MQREGLDIRLGSSASDCLYLRILIPSLEMSFMSIQVNFTANDYRK